MGIQVGGNGGGVGRGRFRFGAPMADINIIPLVDVTLVLLIIFMVTAQVMEFGLNIEVPKVTNQPQASAEELPVVSISSKGELYLADKPVKLVDLAAEIRKKYPNQNAAYIRADKDTVWQPIASVISRLGKEKIACRMVTQMSGN